jgi:hypothetical protein
MIYNGDDINNKKIKLLGYRSKDKKQPSEGEGIVAIHDP